MNNLLKLSENYEKEKHLNALIRTEDNIMEHLTFIFDSAWKTAPEKAPTEVLSFFLDSYYVMPERPDLASLFMWQAINRIYSELILKTGGNNADRQGDLAGIIHFIKEVDNGQFYSYIQPYYDTLPEKIYRFVADYMIDGILAEEIGAKKYIPLSYKTVNGNTVKKNLTGKFQDLIKIIKDSYAMAEKQYTDPRIENNEFVKRKANETNMDRSKLRLISMDLARKLKELIKTGSTNIQLQDAAKTSKGITFTEQEKFAFVLIAILYASRCNNLHGNVASRMNSTYANKETFITYTDIYLLEYMIAAIGLVINGQLDQQYLYTLKNNSNILLQ